MGVLSGPDIRLLFNARELIIESLDPNLPFEADQQITEDGVDLRLGFAGLHYRDELRQVDTLYQEDLEHCFVQAQLPGTGYQLLPNRVLFVSTLEVICLATTRYSGRVFGRSTFARFGVAVHCTQPKFPPGIAWAFPLQLVNHNSFPVVIYPGSYIAQLQIETVSGNIVPYDGKYDKDITLRPPKIDQRELEPVIRAASSLPVLKSTSLVSKRRFEDSTRLRQHAPRHGNCYRSIPVRAG